MGPGLRYSEWEKEETVSGEVKVEIEVKIRIHVNPGAALDVSGMWNRYDDTPFRL